MTTTPLKSAAHIVASKRHGVQMYGDKSYVDGHLAMVVARLHQSGFSHLEDAGWLHDVVEDTPATLTFIRWMFGDHTADIVWAVTSEPGETRKERFAATYPKIRQIGMDALAVKLCDRIENVESCIRTQDSRLRMYQREYSVFRSELISISSDDRIQALWAYLDKLLLQPTA